MNSDIYETIADALANDGYIILEDVLDFSEELSHYVQTLYHDNVQSFHQAGIGRKSEHHKNETIRKDKILWLSQSNKLEQKYLNWMNELQENLNQLLYLGLKSHEAHFSIYEKGDFYKKHYDAFKHTNLSEKNRILTTVFYLNKNYHDNNRGEIVIYDSDDNILETITPNLGKMLIFLSEKFPHEVLPTETTRLSIAGWFR